ncbi:tryptophan-rich sensory protein [Candidatus Gottesmanbacteria bacterium]|nr:tryptophan-rich sensory protein [Candidatus Gottesmanbacteria bacterium]
MIKNGKLLVVALFVPQLAGAIGSLFTVPAISGWYAGLDRPMFSLPNWVFGPVWTTLFLLMGVALYLILLIPKSGGKGRQRKQAVILFGVQLVLNTLWSFIFFGLHSPGLAFVEIISLWIAIAATIGSFYRLSRIAAYLLIPYILWVSFAAFLNYAIWRLN